MNDDFMNEIQNDMEYLHGKIEIITNENLKSEKGIEKEL
jgi:hypothetical protein